MKRDDPVRQYHELRSRGLSQTLAARGVGISRQTAWRYDKALRILGRKPKRAQHPSLDTSQRAEPRMPTLILNRCNLDLRASCARWNVLWTRRMKRPKRGQTTPPPHDARPAAITSEMEALNVSRKRTEFFPGRHLGEPVLTSVRHSPVTVAPILQQSDGPFQTTIEGGRNHVSRFTAKRLHQ